jgi:phytoene dehydrogenase-like protein
MIVEAVQWRDGPRGRDVISNVVSQGLLRMTKRATGDVDVIIVGAGPNGLAAANVVADAGWSVLLLEAESTVGGAVRSDRGVHPDFIHDTFSAFYPLGAASSVIGNLGLEEYGLRWRHAPAVLGHPRPDGRWALLHRDIDATVAGLDEHARGDGAAWRQLYDQWQQIGPALVDSLLSPFPPVRGTMRVLRHLPAVGGMSFLRILLEPAQRLVESRFDSEEARLLLAGCAAHADIPLESPGSGLMALLLTMLGQTVGFPVPEGGAGALSAAMSRRFESLGGTVRCNARVTRIEVVNGKVGAVDLESGERLRAARAVIAAVTAPLLYGGLIRTSDLPSKVRSGMSQFDLDPATVKVDWALDGPVPWSSPPPTMPGTVHIADSVDQLVGSLHQIRHHAVPAEPFLLAGQMAAADESRAPRGGESLWAYTHVPQTVRYDAGEDRISGAWNHDEAERMADRMQHRIESYAPGFSDKIIARRILTPPELQRRDASLIGGAINGGTSELHQQLIFRPIPGFRRASTPIRGLFLASASAHPGGGVHGAPGNNAARAVLRAHRMGRL